MKIGSLLLAIGLAGARAEAADAPALDYRVLATTKTSTMEREMNEAAEAGYTLAAAMGGETAGGGKEAVVVMVKDPAAAGARQYKLLATSKTSTLQEELRRAGADGFAYRSQTVFESAFGGREVCVILERDPHGPSQRFEYRLLATARTSTMQKELLEAGAAGFRLLGMGVGKTAFGGNEVLCVLGRSERRERP